jgi:hypothetical protein
MVAKGDSLLPAAELESLLPHRLAKRCREDERVTLPAARFFAISETGLIERIVSRRAPPIRHSREP